MILLFVNSILQKYKNNLEKNAGYNYLMNFAIPAFILTCKYLCLKALVQQPIANSLFYNQLFNAIVNVDEINAFI